MRLLATAIISLFCVNCFCQDLEDALLLHYPMSGDANDISGNNFHGTVNATLAPDRFGNENEAYHFNGLDEFIDFPNVDELKPPLPLTIAFWIKYDGFASTDRAVFNTSLEEDVNSGVFLTSQSSTGKYAIGFGDGDDVYDATSLRSYASNSVIETELWHHIALIYTSENDMKIYVDCIESGGNYSGSGGQLQYSDFPGSIGRHDQTVGVDAYYFNGSIDEFRYWNRALTIEEIELVCDQTLGVFNQSGISEESFKVYPSPARENLFLSQLDDTYWKSIEIYNSNGKKISSQQFSQNINISNLASGLYFIRLVKLDNMQSKPIKFIKH